MNNPTSAQPKFKPVKRDSHKRRLAKLFRMTSLKDLFIAVWAVRVVGLSQADAAKHFMRFPDELDGAEIGSNYYIMPWLLETLINEGLVHQSYKKGRRKLDLSGFDGFSLIYNAVHELENSESLMDIPEGGIIKALPRLGWRQFEWQEGQFGSRKLYRAWRLYTIPEAAKYFQSKHGVAPDRAIAIGFLVFLKLISRPAITANDAPADWGVTIKDIHAVLGFISKRLPDARNQAARLRKPRGEIAYKPSVLRETPLISIHDGTSEKYFGPLPDLCIQRLCDGLYQDLVDSQSVMQKVAKEFENYCFDVLSHYSGKNFEIHREELYGPKVQKVLTPDLRVSEGKHNLRIIIECKRKLLPYRVASSTDPTRDFPEMYDDFVKGVQQIWRYVSKIRRGIADQSWTIDDRSTGLVLTLHPWMLMSGEVVLWIKKRAAETLKPEWHVLPVDMIPVSLSHMDDLETVLMDMPIGILANALLSHAEDDRVGYSLRHVAGDYYVYPHNIVPFDYNGKISEHVPWWADMLKSDSA